MFYNEDTQQRFDALLANYGAHSLLLSKDGDELAVYVIVQGAQPMKLGADCPVVGLAPSPAEQAAEAVAAAQVSAKG